VSVYWNAIVDALRLLSAFSPDVWEIIWLSLRVSGSAVFFSVFIGVPIGYLLGMTRFAGRAAFLVLLNTAMGFPPVVIGLFVYMALSRSGPLGGLELLFSPVAMVIAQVILSAPLVAGVTTASIASVPRDLRLQMRALGASRLQESLSVLGEARKGVMASVIAAFGQIISEVGAVMIVGGNIEGDTRVMTTAILFNVRRGDFGLAMAWAMVLIGIALTINIALTSLQNVGVVHER
jgi:tungstate transport system permease protein